MTLCLLPTTGCTESGASAAHDEQHNEHFIPEHKPANFAEAVEEIKHRSTHLTQHAGHGHDDEAVEFQELVDIVDWLPELAADSDLNEVDWMAARDSGLALESIIAGCRDQDGTLRLDGLADATAPQLQSLQALVSRAGRPEPAITPDHGSHHHHSHHHHEHDDHGSDTRDSITDSDHASTEVRHADTSRDTADPDQEN
jgi:hypothetical protein